LAGNGVRKAERKWEPVQKKMAKKKYQNPGKKKKESGRNSRERGGAVAIGNESAGVKTTEREKRRKASSKNGVRGKKEPINQGGGREGRGEGV